MSNHSKTLTITFSAAAIALGAYSTDASAQSATSALTDEIFVTATKKASAENVQDVPLAVTGYGSDQLDALKVRDLRSLSYAVPNVQLEDIGTIKGTANFSIRGLGINSSIPSIDPTVGVFIDGIYLGINTGVVLDTFDLEAIEVLRGPQGLLFGRNVTGGAAVIRTKKPGNDFEATAKAAVETGFRGTGENVIVSGSLSGPVVEDVLSLKIAGYYQDDGGWHENLADGSNHGASNTILGRATAVLTPTDYLEFILRYEHGDLDSDGPSSQNRAFFDRNTFDFAIDEPGFSEQQWDQVTFETNWDISLGNGTITNIFGWRDYESVGVSDIDALDDRLAAFIPVPFLFHASFVVDQYQISDELRYSGRFFDRVDFTGGLYYFTQTTKYQESRALPILAASPPAFMARDFSGGGIQDHQSFGVFGQADIDLTNTLTAILGLRYTYEEKDVQIANLTLNATPSIFMPSFPAPPGGCFVIDGPCTFDFVDTDSWNSLTPKVGLQWAANDDFQVYGFWTKGFRSGGYNFRNTSVVFPPTGSFDQESQNTFEIGFKAEPNDGRIRLNTAIFYNRIKNLQRELNLADPLVGVVQLIRNTADADIFGVEAEAQFVVTDGLVLQGSVGYLDGDYKNVVFDLNGDGLVNGLDEALDIPRLAPWTYSAGFVYDHDLGAIGTATARFNYSHRDENPFTDNNLGFFNAADIIDADLSLTTMEERVQFSIYGRNLLNEVTHGGDTILPFPPSPPAPAGVLSTFSPLNKGRVFGFEVKFNYN